jgi:hypothetical protein
MVVNQASSRPPFIATFLIELPFDLGLGEGTTVPAYERREHVEAALFAFSDDHPQELEVDTRLVFRRSRPGSAPPRTMALDVFADFWEGLHLVDSEPARSELEQEAPVTVVAATTATLRYEAATGAITEETLVELFDRVLHQLNEFIAMLGFARSDPLIGTVRRTELPSHVAVMLDIPVSGARQLELSYLELHGFAAQQTPSEEDVSRAIDFAFRDRLVNWPFRSVVLLIHRARRDLLGGDYDQGVIALATAVELLAEATIAAVLRTQDEAHRIPGVLQAGLTNVLRDHLAPMLRRLGADDDVVGRWVDQCYALRKRVAHEGIRPHGTEAMRALNATMDLASTLGTALRRDPTFAHIGDQLPFGS